MKQILLITDGCSNVGVSPVVAAAHAKEEGITVNVIGVVDQGELGMLGAEEIREIAEAGGGMSRIAPAHLLTQTVQMMTRKTVVQSMQEVVSKELRQILGTSEITELPPGKRSEVVHLIDELSESTDLKVALLIDTSASMKPKLNAVREAIRDLLLSLRSRSGHSELAIFHFPGKSGSEEQVEMDSGWTSELANIDKMFYKLNMKGTTPTGPALLRVVQYVSGRPPSSDEDGMLSDYVV